MYVGRSIQQELGISPEHDCFVRLRYHGEDMKTTESKP